MTSITGSWSRTSFPSIPLLPPDRIIPHSDSITCGTSFEIDVSGMSHAVLNFEPITTACFVFISHAKVIFFPSIFLVPSFSSRFFLFVLLLHAEAFVLKVFLENLLKWTLSQQLRQLSAESMSSREDLRLKAGRWHQAVGWCSPLSKNNARNPIELLVVD